MIEILLYSLAIMAASLVGIFSLWYQVGQIIERHLSLLVSFSAGVFIIIAYQLGQEAIAHASSIRPGLVWIMAGVLMVWIVFKLLPTFHHHHDEVLETDHHSKLDARRIMTGDAIHNIGDGILLASSFAISSSLGALTALSIFIHELVQEMSEFFVLREAGYTTKSALQLNFAVSGTILIGSLGGFFLLESFKVFEVPLLGLSAGAFLVVVFHDLIPHSVRESHKKNLYLRHALWFLIGVILMSVMDTLVAH